MTLPSGVAINFDYDSRERLTSRSTTTGELTTLTYNNDDSVQTMQDATGTTTYSYDSSGALSRIDYPTGASVQYVRNLLGQVTSITAKATATGPSYVTQYGYDVVGNLISILDPLNGQTTLEYDAVNRLTKRTLPNGVITDYTYNDRDQLLSITHRNASGLVLASVQYVRAGVGEPTKIIREDGSYVMLGYDNARRLTSEAYYDAANTLLETVTYQYDAAGNRTVRTDGTGTHTSTLQPGYKLTSVDGPGSNDQSFAFDADGRVSTITRDGQTQTLAYDSEDHLRSVQNQTTGQNVNYTFDGAGRRVKVQDSTGEKRLVTAPTLAGLDSPYLVADAAGSLLAGYVYADEHPLLRFGPDGARYYLGDDMGSVIGLADASGQSLAKFLYDGFGNLRQATGSGSSLPTNTAGDFRFQGAWLETGAGLYYFRAREYDPRTGRFLSRDAADPDLLEPESFHPYAFGYSNPFVYRDPTGLWSLIGVGVVINGQNLIRAMKAAAVNAARAYITDQVKGFVGGFIASKLFSFVPGATALINAFDILGDAFEAGRRFGTLVERTFCDALKDWLPNSLYFEPAVFENNPGTRPYATIRPGSSTARFVEPGDYYNGDFVLDGLNCDHPDVGKERSEDYWASRTNKFIKHQPKPDFAVVNKRPTLNRKLSVWVIGDFKVSISRAYDQYIHSTHVEDKKQWRALMDVATSKGFHFSAILALVNSTKKGMKISTELMDLALKKKAATEHAVFLFTFAALPLRRRGVYD